MLIFRLISLQKACEQKNTAMFLINVQTGRQKSSITIKFNLT
ncbi:hypothetical protein yberc0001_18570 [Yersinia bercovieri ATCC 43970]|uniref:Uncharacterized protein n=1 Tax=Yersinia bercovieri ATCC 43970 TaxID=349968 RepID=A0ABM9XYA9_YERBE|nr:hypothetical protein yberc0001_18570 [Yersinia bercovieri ATCC 43970]